VLEVNEEWRLGRMMGTKLNATHVMVLDPFSSRETPWSEEGPGNYRHGIAFRKARKVPLERQIKKPRKRHLQIIIGIKPQITSKVHIMRAFIPSLAR